MLQYHQQQQQLNQRQGNAVVTLYAKDKIRLNSLEVQGEKNLMLFPGEGFHFCVLHEVPTHLSFQRLFLCIFSLIPLLIQVLMSQRLLIASSVGINLTVYNFRACFFLNSFSTRDGVFITGPLKVVPTQTAVLLGTRLSVTYI